MFNDVFQQVDTQLSNDITLSSYVQSFETALKKNTPYHPYTIIAWPIFETEKPESRVYDGIKEYVYQIDIYARMIFHKKEEYITVGYTDGSTTYKGILEFCDDIKQAIRKNGDDLITNYNTNAYSESDTNESSTFALSPTQSNITVSIGANTPTGYNTINCGTSTLTGDEIAANIQQSLTALGQWGDDGYKNALVTFDDTAKKFKIESDVGPRLISVTAGDTNDCSELLGFDNPTEQRGKKILNYEFDTVTDGGAETYPVRFRIVPLFVTEEVYVGG